MGHCHRTFPNLGQEIIRVFVLQKVFEVYATDPHSRRQLRGMEERRHSLGEVPLLLINFVANKIIWFCFQTYEDENFISRRAV